MTCLWPHISGRDVPTRIHCFLLFSILKNQKQYKSIKKNSQRPKSIKLHLIKWFQEGHSRCLWIFLQTCPPGHLVRLWASQKTTVCLLQYDPQANFVWSCLNKSPGDHLNMREVTSAIPDILQRTAPSCMRPMYQDLLAHVCVFATWLNLPSIPMASCPRWGTSPPLTRMCLVPRTLTELLLTRSDSSAFGARLPRSQCSQGMGIQDLPAEIQGKHWSLRHFTDSHSIKYLTDNEKGFESRKSIAASPQWFASPTEMAHLQAPLKILSDTSTEAHWTWSHHQQWRSAASWL